MDIARAINTGLFVQQAEMATPELESGYTLLKTIYVNDMASELSPDKSNSVVSIGYVAQSNDEIVVALRGTDSIWEWLQNAKIIKVPFNSTAQVEDGFYSMYQTLIIDDKKAADYINSLLKGSTTIRVCGHSLGAGLATLLAADLHSDICKSFEVYTFASPYVGDQGFASQYYSIRGSIYRIANRIDIITHLVGSNFGYVHVGELHEFNSALKFGIDPLTSHHMTTYLAMLNS